MKKIFFDAKHLTGALAVAVLAGALNLRTPAAEFGIKSYQPGGILTWSNYFLAGVTTIETANVASGHWSVGNSFFTSNSIGTSSSASNESNFFLRLLAVDISTNTPRHY